MRIVLFIVALLALAFWGFAAFDMWAVLTAWPPYAEQYGADMFVWIQGFPLWRKAVWGASVGFGVIGSLMMLGRVRGAGPVLLLAWMLLAGGFAYDVALQDGAQNYGQQGMIATAVLIVLAALFAWTGFAATASVGKPSSAAAPREVAPPAPAQQQPIQAAPEALAAPVATTVAEAAPAPSEAPPTPLAAAEPPPITPPVEATTNDPSVVEASPAEMASAPPPSEDASHDAAEAASGASGEAADTPPSAPEEKPSS